jgi:hypothetical protein
MRGNWCSTDGNVTPGNGVFKRCDGADADLVVGKHDYLNNTTCIIRKISVTPDKKAYAITADCTGKWSGLGKMLTSEVGGREEVIASLDGDKLVWTLRDK